MSTVVLTTRRIEARHSGYDLRVAQLCARIPGPTRLVVLPLHPLPDPVAAASIDAAAIFSDIQQWPPLLPGRGRARRHLRRSNRHLLALARPQALAAARSRLRAELEAHGITHVVAFGDYLAELVADLDGVSVVLDVCDSDALTIQRAVRAAGGVRRPGNWKGLLDLSRVRRTEAGFPDAVDYVTTISEPDSAEIRRLHGGPTPNVRTVPNGVDEQFLGPLPEPGGRRGVVFWGNLEFPPNDTALAMFVQRHLPQLHAAGAELRVIGANAPDWLVELAARDPLVSLAGFVPDLRAEVAGYPVMINPMCTGSGLKNKVLEAFGLGLAVVSTPLGVEAFPDVRDGEHAAVVGEHGFGAAVHALLDDPARRELLRANANRLLHEQYRWSVVGRDWAVLFAAGRSVADHG